MEPPISRSEKKRQVKDVENLAGELVELPKASIQQLPCDDFIKKEIIEAKELKAGSRKRQIKYISKNLRALDCTPLLDFLSQKKGSKLKEAKTFHELEYLRDQILAETFEAQFKAEKEGERLDSSWQSEMVDSACTQFPGLDKNNLKDAAIKFAVTRKIVFKREIFRMLKAAQEQLHFSQK
jgi:ribosome-associated protein